MRHGQFDDERGSAGFVVPRRNAAAVFLDDAVGKTQAKPRAFADFFGVKNGLKSLFKFSPRDARSVVLEKNFARDPPNAR